MKILFITRGFPSESDMMLGNYESVQARALAKMGHDVVNICAPSVYKSELHIFDKNRLSCRVVDGVKVYERTGIFPYLFARFFHPGWLTNFFVKMSYNCLISEVIRKEGLPDIAHIHILYVAYFALSAKCIKGIPVVITEHWTKMQSPLEHAELSRMTCAYKKADAIIAVSQSLSNSVQHYSNTPVRTIYNMVDDSFWIDVPKYKIDSKFHFISVGRLCDNKHFDMLIDAFLRCDFSEDTVLDIVGEGENRAELEKLIEKTNLGGRVVLHGLKTSSEVGQMLSSSDCFVLSSKLETFGIVLIEAMAKGLPVIATRCGGPEEFITSESGIIVPNDNCEEFASAMKKMRKDAVNYDKEKIKRYCYDNFSQKAIGEKIVEVYNQVLRK